jgi:hypothetical protein
MAFSSDELTAYPVLPGKRKNWYRLTAMRFWILD